MKNHLASTLFLLTVLWSLPACAESSDAETTAEAAVRTAYAPEDETTPAPQPESAPDQPTPAPSSSAPSSTDQPSTENPATPSRKPNEVQRPTEPSAANAVATPEKKKLQSRTPNEMPKAPTPPDHSQWNQLLQQHVSANGKVDYAGLLKKKEQLESYLNELAQAVPGQDWSRNAALAYWLNAYNAFTVKLILDNWPVQSIKDIRNGTPWDDKWIELAGEKYSLNQIENEIIRPRFKDPRIHFAVNCAAVSCPPLHNRAFTAANVDRTLEQLTRSFINNEQYNTITSDAATVSKVFDWYRQDFGTLSEYLDRYAEASVTADTDIRFKDYDWGLNN